MWAYRTLARSSKRSITVLLTVLICSPALGQDVHILLRAKDGKNWFHLGEPIVLEAACQAEGSKGHLLPCNVVLKAEPFSFDGKLSLDRIDSSMLEHAQCGAFPTQPYGRCGTISGLPPAQQSPRPIWQDTTLQEPFPTTAGHYKIIASLQSELEAREIFGDSQKLSPSDEVEIVLDDNLGWKDSLTHFHNCDYDDKLTLLPDIDAVAALRRHLDDCAVEVDDREYRDLLDELVWLKLQLERPDLYTEMQKFEQAEPAEVGEVSSIQAWIHDRYRDLLLETAHKFVRAYKEHPDLHGNEGFEEDLSSGFENWRDAAATLCGGADDYISRAETIKFLKDAGRSQKDINAFLAGHKSVLPGDFHEYNRYHQPPTGP
jgi:hypothetical protein